MIAVRFIEFIARVAIGAAGQYSIEDERMQKKKRKRRIIISIVVVVTFVIAVIILYRYLR